MKHSVCCHSTKSEPHSQSLRKIVILGSPNVGKSVLFNNFTGRYVTVANYPGTTVEVAKGKAQIGEFVFEVMDTPGIYSLTPLTEEEGVARRILFNEHPFLVLHIVDAKNLERMLPLTLQLIETGVPIVLILNMMDEVRRWGVQINRNELVKELGIPVVGTVSTTGEGMGELKETILRLSHLPRPLAGKANIIFDGPVGDSIETAVENLESVLQEKYPIAKRSVGLFLLKGDEEVWKMVEGKEPASLISIRQIVEKTKACSEHPLEFDIAVHLQKEASRISGKAFKSEESLKEVNGHYKLHKVLNFLTMNPWTGFPILFLILYFGLYQFVGIFGAGTVVNFLERTVFETYVNPFLVRFFTALIPWVTFRDLFVGEYGILTQGVRYAVALILPIVTFYFTVFAIIEDTGYLPRLAMLMDRTFKKIGLSGRAIIPMVLGFGCDTMATMVTRTLPSMRERIISTLLLALAIPCSAQLGVILALLSGHGLALSIWAGVMAFVFLLVGFLVARILPGEHPSFYMELPPMRWPKLTNVLTKTYVRVKWYLVEVLPLFIIASVLIWLGQLSGLFGFLTHLLSFPVKMIGLPEDAAHIFLMGFFRRDYGAAGLYDLVREGLLNQVQILVACVALTLFLPCIAQFLMNIKERGWRTGLVISVFILFFSFGVAVALNWVLVKLGVAL